MIKSIEPFNVSAKFVVMFRPDDRPWLLSG